MVTNANEPTAIKLCICCHGEFPADLTTCPKDGTPLAAVARHDLVGTVLADRYEILSVIGGGGMGLVYRAKHRMMNRTVAIKVLHKSHSTDQTTLKRFQLEAQAASALSNPNIVTIYDFGTSPDGEPYMVMDLLDGHSLADLLEAGEKLSIARALSIFIQVCGALGHAHDKGILHRDIKPSNIMLLDSDGQTDSVKVVDFGIAKLMDSSNLTSANLTRTGEVFGSPMYMSPEQWQGRKLDARVDIYALGAVMYKVLTQNSIFEDGDMLRLMYKQVTEIPVPFAAHEVAIAPELEAIVFKALAKDPDERYQSMGEMREALEQFNRFRKTIERAVIPAVAAESAQNVEGESNGLESTLTTKTDQVGAQPPLSSAPANSQPIVPPDTISKTIPIIEQAKAPSSDAVEKPKLAKEQTIQISIPKRTAGIGLAIGLTAIGGLALFLFVHANPPVATPLQSSRSRQAQPVLEKVSPPPPEKAAKPEPALPTIDERKRAHRRRPVAVKPHPQHAPASAPAPQTSSSHTAEPAPRGITKLKNGIKGIKKLLDSL